MQTSIPRGEHEPRGRQHERGGQVQGIEGEEVAVKRQRRGMLGEALVDFNDSEGRPLPTHGLRRRRAAGKTHGADGLDEADTTDEPAIAVVQRVADDALPSSPT